MPTYTEQRVGIWWYWKKIVFDYSSPISQAEEVEGFSNGPICHADAWPDLQKTVLEFFNLDYPDIPRGRVVAMNQTEFVLYGARLFLANDKKTDAILNKFCLERAATTLRSDEHYEKTNSRANLPPLKTNEDELEELYDEFPELQER